MVEARFFRDARSMVWVILSRDSWVSTASIKYFKLPGLFGETCQSFLNRESAISTIIPQLVTISIELSRHIAEVRLHRPDRSKALNEVMWLVLRTAFLWADSTPGVRVMVLSAAGHPWPQENA